MNGLQMLLGLVKRILPYRSLLLLGAALLWLALSWPLWRSLPAKLKRRDFLDEGFLMLVATLGALLIGEILEALAVLALYHLGAYLEARAVARSRRAIAELLDILPDEVHLLREGEWLDCRASEARVGEQYRLSPGERFPLDGRIVSGRAAVDTASLTGESLPQDLGPGDAVFAAALNLDGSLLVEITAEQADSEASRLQEMVEEATEQKAGREVLISRFARFYTPAVLALAALLALSVPLIWPAVGWSESIRRALTFLVVSCPCAFVLSVPLSYFAGLGMASRQGILIKGGVYLERLAELQEIYFDKTGTLTEGAFRLTGVRLLRSDAGEKEAVEAALRAELHASHPLAEALRHAYPDLLAHVEKEPWGELHELAGQGLIWEGSGRRYVIGNAALMAAEACELPPESESGASFFLADERGALAAFYFEDCLKSDAVTSLMSLKKLGIKHLGLLSGDRPEKVASLAAQLPLDSWQAGLLPAEKLSALEEAGRRDARTAFVGDGLNDAAALARADVGIAMGRLGTALTLEAADVVLLDDRLDKLPAALRLARSTLRVVRQNIAFSLLVKLGTLALAAAGQVPMAMAVFADVGVTLLCVANALRLLTTTRPSPGTMV